MLMKAVTIYQPYASLIACGAKQFETRSWKTNYRGPIAIHAGKESFHLTLWQGMPAAQEALVKAFGGWIDQERGGAQGLDARYHDMPYGAVVATADLVECWYIGHVNWKGQRCIGTGGSFTGTHDDERYDYIDGDELLFGDWREGRWAWELANVKPLPVPVPCRGKQGLWDWEL